MRSSAEMISSFIEVGQNLSPRFKCLWYANQLTIGIALSKTFWN